MGLFGKLAHQDFKEKLFGRQEYYYGNCMLQRYFKVVNMKPKPQAIASVNSHPEIDNMACKGFDLNYHQAFHPNCWSNPIHD